jgi:hypothetical protein
MTDHAIEVVEMHPVAVAKVKQFRIAERPAATGAEIRRHPFAVQLVPAVL